MKSQLQASLKLHATLEALAAWEDVLDDASYYELLGVLEICDADALRVAYHEFAQAFHPDLYRGEPEVIQERARRIFQRGTEAYRVLGDRELRIRYDLALSRGKRRLDDPFENRPIEPPPGSVRSRPLEDLARSVEAKMCAHRAAKLIESGDLAGARAQLKAAIEFDAHSNKELAERLEALEIALFAGGG